MLAQTIRAKTLRIMLQLMRGEHGVESMDDSGRRTEPAGRVCTAAAAAARDPLVLKAASRMAC